MTTAGVLLAAGAGSRFAGAGTHKLLARLGDRTVFEHALGAVLAAGLDKVIVVTGAADLDDLLGGRPVTVVANARWADGIATSVQAGVTAAERAGHDAIVVGLLEDEGILATSAAQLELLVPRDQTAPLLEAVSNEHALSVVPLAHPVGAAP